MLGMFENLGTSLMCQPGNRVHVRMCPRVWMVNCFKISLLVLIDNCTCKTRILKKHL